MRRKKVLFVSEAPWYSTGYSVYTTQVLQRLVQCPHLECAQLAIYTDNDDPNISKFPWKIYGNKPDKTHPNYSVYQANPTTLQELAQNQELS